MASGTEPQHQALKTHQIGVGRSRAPIGPTINQQQPDQLAGKLCIRGSGFERLLAMCLWPERVHALSCRELKDICSISNVTCTTVPRLQQRIKYTEQHPLAKRLGHSGL